MTKPKVKQEPKGGMGVKPAAKKPMVAPAQPTEQTGGILKAEIDPWKELIEDERRRQDVIGALCERYAAELGKRRLFGLAERFLGEYHSHLLNTLER